MNVLARTIRALSSISLTTTFLLCLSIEAAQALSPQRGGLNPHAHNRQLLGEEHPDYMRYSSMTEPADAISSPINYPGSEHTPSGMSKNQNRKPNFKEIEEVEIGVGGTANNSPYIEKKGGVQGANVFQKSDPGKDDDKPPAPGENFRVISPNNVVREPKNLDEATLYQEVIKEAHNLPGEESSFSDAYLEQKASRLEADLSAESGRTMRNTEAAMCGMAEMASEAMSEQFNPTWLKMLTLSATPLINVGNFSSGSKCSSSKPVKTHSNAIYIVQQAYSHIYIPIAVLLLLPGAVATQLKSLLSAGILNNSNDEDAVSPFSGILKVLVAIFLIPASQLIVSYSIDVGNSTQFEISRHINYLNIYMYADEQVFSPPQDSFPGTLLPAEALKSLGKLQGTPEKLAKRFNMSKASVMLQGLANGMCQAVAFGLVVSCAFQIVMSCYLLLMGPIAAAFYAWPSGVGGMFSRVFAGWVDGMVNLALWRFWWCIILLVMDTRLCWLSGLFNIYSLWELLMFIAFLVIMSTVPFNPFDFKAGEMVQRVMDKSDEAVQEASNKN